MLSCHRIKGAAKSSGAMFIICGGWWRNTCSKSNTETKCLYPLSCCFQTLCISIKHAIGYRPSSGSPVLTEMHGPAALVQTESSQAAIYGKAPLLSLPLTDIFWLGLLHFPPLTTLTPLLLVCLYLSPFSKNFTIIFWFVTPSLHLSPQELPFLSPVSTPRSPPLKLNFSFHHLFENQAQQSHHWGFWSQIFCHPAEGAGGWHPCGKYR